MVAVAVVLATDLVAGLIQEVEKADAGTRAESRQSYGRRIGDEWAAATPRVLLGLRDPESAGSLAKRFDEAGLLPTLAFSCGHLVREARQDTYGLIVLDADFACDHNSECLRKVRGASRAPIMAVGKLDDGGHTDVDVALDPDREAGEIVERATALVEMSRPVRLPAAVRWGPLELDMGRHTARWQGRHLHLTKMQFRIMEILVMAAGSVVSVEQLSGRVWGESSIDERDRLVAHIRRIRRLIEDDPSSPRFLVRVRGRGFRLRESPSETEPPSN